MSGTKKGSYAHNPRNASSEDIEIGNRIRERRELLGMSQGELAKSLGITFQQVQKYENGVNRVAAGRLVAIAKTLEAPISYFYAGLDEGGIQENSDWLVVASPSRPYNKGKDEDPQEARNKRLMLRDIEVMVKAFRKIKDVETRRNFIQIVSQVAPD